MKKKSPLIIQGARAGFRRTLETSTTKGTKVHEEKP